MGMSRNTQYTRLVERKKEKKRTSLEKEKYFVQVYPLLHLDATAECRIYLQDNQA
jgi:hypothetical protein